MGHRYFDLKNHEKHVGRLFGRFANEFDRQVESEAMRNEIGRARFLAAAFGLLAATALLFHVSLRGALSAVNLGGLDLAAIVLVLAAYALYEIGYSYAIALFLKHGAKFPAQPKYLNALIEISLPSLALFILLGQFSPELAIGSPPAYVYFLFVVLSTLRLEPRLAAFTGVVAGLEFFGLALAATLSAARAVPEPAAAGAAAALSPAGVALAMAASKAGLMAVAGLIAAYVSRQVRRRVESAVRSLDEQERVRSVFGQQVSPAVMERLLHQGGEAESEARQVCVMFLDIRDFTRFSQDKAPQDVVEYLNRLWDFMIEIVNRNQGIINKFLGDGFMAVFGAPLPDADASLHAVRAALEISDRLRLEQSGGGLPATGIGIGLHAGLAVTGNVGSRERREYTIIGDVVNLASRIEQLNKQHGSEILVSGEVWQAVQNSLAGQAELAAALAGSRTIGPTTVKGRDRAVDIVRIR